MKKRILISLLFTIFVWVCIDSAEAQCAMCRQTAENAAKENAAIGQGLNTGIVYLMIAPYILFLVALMVFFRKKIAAFFRS